jgi:hypothetical protein
MRLARTLLTALCGLVLLATAPRLATAQFMPDLPVGGTMLGQTPPAEPSSEMVTASFTGSIDLRAALLNVHPGLITYGWVMPKLRRPAAGRSTWHALHYRVAR